MSKEGQNILYGDIYMIQFSFDSDDVCNIIKIIIFELMEDPQVKMRAQLVNANELFKNKQYNQCRKLLGDIKMTHESIELNLLLTEYKESPNKIHNVLKKMLDILTAINIKLYQNRPQNHNQNNHHQVVKSPKIHHELYYWNIIVLAQLIANSEVAELITNQALHFVDSIRTETSLMLIYQMLSTMETSGRLASCISLIEKQNRLLPLIKKLSKDEYCFRFLNQILFNKVLLKLGMIQGSRIMYDMKFHSKEQDMQITEINGIPTKVYQQILNAEIEYHSKNYHQAMKILAELLPQTESLGKNKEYLKAIIDHNIALNLIQFKSSISPQIAMRKSMILLHNAKDLQFNPQKNIFINKIKQNLLLSSLQYQNHDHSQIYQSLKQFHHSYSYKINYRKAQICLNYYHEILKTPQKVLTFKEIHDFYETIFHYPNQPYFQQKGKNKNPNYTNGKFYYRRFVLGNREERFNDENNMQKQSQKGSKEKKKEKVVVVKTAKNAKKQEQNMPQEIKEQGSKVQSNKDKLREILEVAEYHLKISLTILQKEKSTIVNLQGEEKGLTQQVNQKLYSDYIEYKSSIYSLLCYIYLCRQEWMKTIHYAKEYQTFEKIYQIQNKNNSQQQTYYNILAYEMEAYSQLNRMPHAYEIMHEIVNRISYEQSLVINARSTLSHELGQVYFQKMSQYNNLCFNISVMHSKDNKIPESFQSIQKILQQMRLSPSNPQANIPLSLVELLIHYNLRTSNNQSALQMIKRRRILNLTGVIGNHYQPTINITK